LIVPINCKNFANLSSSSLENWLSILRTPYTTQNLQRKRRTDLHILFITSMNLFTRVVETYRRLLYIKLPLMGLLLVFLFYIFN
jgi:hypothetical protein